MEKTSSGLNGGSSESISLQVDQYNLSGPVKQLDLVSCKPILAYPIIPPSLPRIFVE